MSAMPQMPSHHPVPEPHNSVRLGDRLRAKRKARGWSLAEASARSSVRERYISALERHDVEALPTLGYALGYVRAYARALGLDPEQAVKDFKRDSEAPRASSKFALPHFVPTRRVQLPRGSVPALGVLGAVVMLGTWYGVQLDTVAAPVPAAQIGFDPAEVEPSAPIPDSILTVQATAPSWVTIRDARGRVRVNRVFVTGESWQTDVGDLYTLDVRDSGAIELRIGETSLGALGEPGVPLRDFNLSTVR